ncbi:hypothetical protein H3H36_10785 [Duganella sp. FT3S]|uniref:DUF4376 domain-containing protein n=1 Tax=Rugamonas fusca TaxID=2758568 RepID=A0A7W2EH80_9BURK|nr:hypothetical protein [Rugamonas fusca]MBA5605846.1 hypothetical protein [Rugamonas fusca]
MNICKIRNGFYAGHRVADQYSTWDSDEVRIDPPQNMLEGKFYRLNGDGTWIECDSGVMKTREELKAERQVLVDSITVTTNSGHVFDGDEVSQGRMARAIIALQGTGAQSVTWVLADNSVIEAGVGDLIEALALAGAAQAAIWVIA